MERDAAEPPRPGATVNAQAEPQGAGASRAAPAVGASSRRRTTCAAISGATMYSTTDSSSVSHGTVIAVPYRPLEASDAPATRTWIAAQNELTARVLDGLPERPAIRRRLAELWNYPRAGAPWRRGDRWFQLRNTGLQDQDVLWPAEDAAADGRVPLDPNRLSEQGTTALSAVAVSESGDLIAAATSDAGSDWRTWSAKTIPPGWSGKWRVEVRDAENDLLQTIFFTLQ